jgi:hypothetical protein
MIATRPPTAASYLVEHLVETFQQVTAVRIGARQVHEVTALTNNPDAGFAVLIMVPATPG